jgi:hypothetical protein
MGGTQSDQSTHSNMNFKGIFHKDLVKISEIVNAIINTNGSFKDSSYNFMNPKVCEKYTMVLESKLSKHLKIHLHDLAENVIFIPKNNNDIKLKKHIVTKKNMCSLICTHYKKTLQILSLIREIYDFENGGDFSIAGIVYRNLGETDEKFEVSYCGSEQQPLINNGDDRVDLKNLKGLDSFVNDFLTKEESDVFVLHLKQLFGNVNKKNIAKHICNDTIVNINMYQNIYEDIKVNCNKGGSEKNNIKKHNALLFKIQKNKPILSYELCFNKEKITKPKDKTLSNLFTKYKEDYLLNIEHILVTIHRLVIYDTKEKNYSLRNLTYEQLISVEKEVKKCIITLFIQSLVNYFKILNHVKK